MSQPDLFTCTLGAGDPVLLAEPVGTLVAVADGPWGLATATYDPTRTWRYRLSRVWDPTRPRVCWIMLNPSTATEDVTDPTVERTLRYAASWGYGASEVVNIFAYRATDPTVMRAQPDPVGPGNDTAILAAAHAADLVVCAWGTHGTHLDRADHVTALLRTAGVPTTALTTTRDGHPGHPLYLRKDAHPVPWPTGPLHPGDHRAP
jgi:hypothetical protein